MFRVGDLVEDINHPSDRGIVVIEEIGKHVAVEWEGMGFIQTVSVTTLRKVGSYASV